MDLPNDRTRLEQRAHARIFANRQVGALLLGRIDCEWAVGEVMLQRIVAEADLFMTGALEFDLQALS